MDFLYKLLLSPIPPGAFLALGLQASITRGNWAHNMPIFIFGLLWLVLSIVDHFSDREISDWFFSDSDSIPWRPLLPGAISSMGLYYAFTDGFTKGKVIGILLCGLWFSYTLADAFTGGRLAEWLGGEGGEGGFEDWVKNPDWKASIEAERAERDAIRIPENVTEEEMKRYINGLYDKDDKTHAQHRLTLCGEKALPLLVRELAGPRLAPDNFRLRGDEVIWDLGFCKVCDLLKPFAPAEAAEPLSRLAVHKDGHIRQLAATALGNIASPACIGPLKGLVDDKDESVRSGALYGIMYAREAGRGGGEFVREMFPAVAARLGQADRDDQDAPQALLALDPEKAEALLLSERFFTLENKGLHHIVEALNKKGRKVPLEKLLPLLQKLLRMEMEYPHEYDLAELLVAYANNPDENAGTVIAGALKHRDGTVRSGAASALMALNGIGDPWEIIERRLREKGPGSLTEPQQIYAAVQNYDMEVNNGGHSQYFVNGTGDEYPAALKGLGLIGAEGHAEVLRRALAVFGKSGPSTDKALRHKQLSRLSKAKEEELDELDSFYYDLTENLDALLAPYVIRNKSHFVDEKQAEPGP